VVPTGQGVHTEAPEDAAKVSEGHVEHVWPKKVDGILEAVPARHCVHELEVVCPPAAVDVPSGQLRHAVCPV